jgi:hypothetical protein
MHEAMPGVAEGVVHTEDGVDVHQELDFECVTLRRERLLQSA